MEIQCSLLCCQTTNSPIQFCSHQLNQVGMYSHQINAQQIICFAIQKAVKSNLWNTQIWTIQLTLQSKVLDQPKLYNKKSASKFLHFSTFRQREHFGHSIFISYHYNDFFFFSQIQKVVADRFTTQRFTIQIVLSHS